EEQRLGVYHKEKLKLRYPDVDVLTLSATPIPRTLYQTLIQVKSISYVRTPPEGRLPVITRVGMYAPEAVRSAVASELARNGQVLYLYNRIQGLNERADRIQEWFPHTRVSVAHGRMKSRDLEKTIREFISGECRVLVSTTLIENGVDIPGADTLIVEEAERYGLAELHQLRGRVGRGPRQAYAYFFTDPKNPLPSGARERLKAISRYSYLGAGFELSYRDLELRGAGELLGRRQHGFAAQVGLIMYARALGSALAPLLGKKIPHRPQIEIPASAYLPSDYVPLEEERARIYEEILQAEEVGSLERVARDLESLYGRLPLPVRTLLDIAYLRKLAEVCSLDRLELDPSGKIARFEGDVHSDLLLPFPQIRDIKTDPHSGSTRFVAIIRNKENALDELRALLEHLVQDAALRTSEKVI
ncbi:MAG: helicase-related protein, partial [bacterium JZ-2024 1]